MMILVVTPLSAEYADQVSSNFQLVDPEMAPPDIRPAVMRGYKIMMQTQKYLPEYAGDAISCVNCHFAGGNTLGGPRGGISLVGVAQKYPIHLEGDKFYTLADRINACFERSLNGKPLPIDSEDMKSLLAYFDWISSPVSKLSDPLALPWLGLKRIRIEHTMDPKNGEQLFASRCALCHGSHGRGQPRKDDLGYPPLWGPKSFNDAAGMNQLLMLASFIQLNMPYDEPSLTIEQALDIAAFIISQPRPHYEEPKK
jgi:thiosulfate dehydrogenase